MFGIITTLLAGILIGAWAMILGPKVLLFAAIPVGVAYAWRRLTTPLNGIAERP